MTTVVIASCAVAAVSSVDKRSVGGDEKRMRSRVATHVLSSANKSNWKRRAA